MASCFEAVHKLAFFSWPQMGKENHALLSFACVLWPKYSPSLRDVSLILGAHEVSVNMAWE